MLRLRNVVAGFAAGLALTVVGAGTAAADHPPPECADGSGGAGIYVAGGLDLSGVLDGLLGGIIGGHGHCCPDDDGD
jgi:hypothetical protein